MAIEGPIEADIPVTISGLRVGVIGEVGLSCGLLELNRLKLLLRADAESLMYICGLETLG